MAGAGETLRRGLDRLARMPVEGWVTLGVIVACTIYVFAMVHPELIFTNNTPTGGDMGAHVIGPHYLVEHLLPQGRVSGWTPDWFAGYPLYRFYMVVPALAIAALWAGLRSWVLAPGLVLALAIGVSGWFVPALWRARRFLLALGIFGVIWAVPVPYGIAFKIVTILGLLTLPAACWAFARLTGLRFPFPPLFALAGFFYLFARFVESSSPDVANIGNIIGGNLASTMAGEYSFSIALSVGVVYLGVLARGLRTGRHRALAAGLLALCGLCHLLPFFFVLLATAIMLAVHWSVRRLAWLVPVLVTAGLLAAFWMLPFVWDRHLTNDMGWDKLPYPGGHLGQFLLPGRFLWVVALAAVGLVVALLARDRTGWFLSASTVATALAVVFIPQAQLWNARILPFYFLSLFLLAAYGAAGAVTALAHDCREAERRPAAFGMLVSGVAGLGVYLAFFVARPWPKGHFSARPTFGEYLSLFTKTVPALYLLLFAACLVAYVMFRMMANEPSASAPLRGLTNGFVGAALVAVVGGVALPLGAWPASHHAPEGQKPYNELLGYHTQDQNQMSSWARWNYSGYEDKPATASSGGWTEYKAVVDTMARLGRSPGHGCGRALWEEDNDREGGYGTPMALMLLPYWTDSCITSMEGLYFESSSTTPYHFLLASEASSKPSDPQRDLPYRGLNLDDAVPHMRLLGVRYYLADTTAAQKAADQQPGLHRVATSGPWKIYQVRGSSTVVGLDRLPAVWDRQSGQDSWLDPSVAWWQDPSRWSVPFAAGGPDNWPRVKLDGATWSSAWDAVGNDLSARMGVTDFDPLPGVRSRHVRAAKVRHVHMGTSDISFDVDRPGTPVLVKASYFPNWKASGAEGPWRVTPNLMVVVPTASHVSLHYGRSGIDIASWLLTLAGIALLVLLALLPPVAMRRWHPSFLERAPGRHRHERHAWRAPAVPAPPEGSTAGH